jgi:hypothetical protein
MDTLDTLLERYLGLLDEYQRMKTRLHDDLAAVSRVSRIVAGIGKEPLGHVISCCDESALLRPIRVIYHLRAPTSLHPGEHGMGRTTMMIACRQHG